MSGFIRPEATAFLRRWSEVIIAVCTVALGLVIAARPGLVVSGFGYVMAVGGALALLPAIRRARFAASGEGPGVVQVDERRILYLGPQTGGAVALDELALISLRRGNDGTATWILVEAGQVLTIPVDAKGAEALFDAFTALPGLSAQHVLAVAENPHPGTHRLWARAQAPALTG